jgi:hypothetical protein
MQSSVTKHSGMSAIPATVYRQGGIVGVAIVDEFLPGEGEEE